MDIENEEIDTIATYTGLRMSGMKNPNKEQEKETEKSLFDFDNFFLILTRQEIAAVTMFIPTFIKEIKHIRPWNQGSPEYDILSNTFNKFSDSVLSDVIDTEIKNENISRDLIKIKINKFEAAALCVFMGEIFKQMPAKKMNTKKHQVCKSAYQKLKTGF